MATINQQGARLDVVGVAGSPLTLNLSLSMQLAGGSVVPWSNFTAASVQMLNTNRGAFPAGDLPTVTNLGSGSVSVVWNTSQTADIATMGGKTQWVLMASIGGTGPLPIVAGVFRVPPPETWVDTPSSSTTFTVTVGTALGPVTITGSVAL